MLIDGTNKTNIRTLINLAGRIHTTQLSLSLHIMIDFLKKISPLNNFPIKFSLNCTELLTRTISSFTRSSEHFIQSIICSSLIVALNQRSAELKKANILLNFHTHADHYTLNFFVYIKFGVRKTFLNMWNHSFYWDQIKQKKKNMKKNNNNSHQIQRENIYETHPQFPLPTWNSIFERKNIRNYGTQNMIV